MEDCLSALLIRQSNKHTPEQVILGYIQWHKYKNKKQRMKHKYKVLLHIV